MKKTLALLLAMALLLASAALAEESVAGDWYADLGGAAAQLTLKEDGTYLLTIPGSEPLAGEWKAEDGFVYIDGAEEAELWINGEGRLVLAEGGILFNREAPETYAPAEPRENTLLEIFAGYWKSAYVDVDGVPLPARLAEDNTDLYVEGHSAILGGPVFGDKLVTLTYENGALSCEADGLNVLMQCQLDGLLRLTVTQNGETRTWYLSEAYSPALEKDE